MAKRCLRTIALGTLAGIASMVGLPVAAATTSVPARPDSATVMTSAAGGTITSSSGSFTSGPVDAFKNDGSSRLLKQSKTFNLMYTFAEPAKVNGYGIMSGGNYFNENRGRGPKAWKIYGSNDYVPAGGTGSTGEAAANAAAVWTELDSRTGETEWSNNEYRYFSFVNERPFTTYKIEISDNNGDPNGYTQWKYLEYCHLPSASLVVAGTPFEINEVSPAFGRTAMPDAETTFTSSANAVTEAGDVRTVCTGWKVYTINEDGETWTEDPARAGSGNSFTWSTMPSATTKVEWQYASELKVSAASHPFGAVQTSAEWVAHGTTVTVSASANAGYEFWRWDGDVPAEKIAENPLTLTVENPLKLQAAFRPAGAAEYVQYVAVDGDDANDGFTPATAKLTIPAAIGFFRLTPGVPGELKLLPGTHATGAGDKVNPVKIDIPLTVSGCGGRDEVVISGDSKCIGFLLNHPQASICGVTITKTVCKTEKNGAVGSYAGAVTVGPAGGLLENCRIEGCKGEDYGANTGGVRLEGGRMNRCEIRNCLVSNENEHGGAKGTSLEIRDGAIAENSLVAGGYTAHETASRRSATVLMSGGTLRNCTIWGNRARSTGGVSAAAGSQVVNCAIFGNTTILNDGETDAAGWSGSAEAFVKCASDDGEAINGTCLAGTAEKAFTDSADGNLTPAMGGLLYNAGIAYAGMSALDLAGNPRQTGRAVDIGCYESTRRVGLVIVVQ